MKQIFQGKTLTTTKCVNNILKVYHRNESPVHWYEEAHLFARELYFTHRSRHDKETLTAKICGVIAALSPRKSWEHNKKVALQFLETGKCGHTKLFVEKATSIMGSDGNIETICDILNGNKITSFFLNIYNPSLSNIVTIDRHAIDIAVGRVLGEDKRGMTAKQYQFFVNCYVVAGNKLGQLPNYVQSTT